MLPVQFFLWRLTVSRPFRTSPFLYASVCMLFGRFVPAGGPGRFCPIFRENRIGTVPHFAETVNGPGVHAAVWIFLVGS